MEVLQCQVEPRNRYWQWRLRCYCVFREWYVKNCRGVHYRGGEWGPQTAALKVTDVWYFDVFSPELMNSDCFWWHPWDSWRQWCTSTKARKQLRNEATLFSKSVRTPVVLASNGKHPPTSCQKAWKRRVLPAVHVAVNGRVHSWLRSTEVWLFWGWVKVHWGMPFLDLHNFIVDCCKQQTLQPGMPVKFYFWT